MKYSLLIFGCLLVLSGCLTGKHNESTLPRVTVRPVARVDSTVLPVPARHDSLSDTAIAADSILSRASRLVIDACENYMIVNPQNPKASQVLDIKASLYYNNRLYEQARSAYERILKDYPNSPEKIPSMRMIAQSFYEQKQFTQAQEWYRKLTEVAASGGDRDEALRRIAESIFGQAEQLEKEQHYSDAAQAYERVAMEFPDVAIADVSLYDAGLAWEKQAEWARAVLAYQRLSQKYPKSQLVQKSTFRAAKSYEKMMQWDNAAQTYLKAASQDPATELAQTAMYNAGFSFENGGKIIEAAATFEKFSQLFQNSADAADVLFKAGELYGSLKDWDGVQRVNSEFTRRFGNDEDRLVQAQCMVGIALYMQDKRDAAVNQLEKAVASYRRLKTPSVVNRFYAAKAQYTLGEINESVMNSISLASGSMKVRLTEKATVLDNTVKSFGRVLDMGVLEWTTRSLFQIGQSYEEFALAIAAQPRTSGQSMDGMLALELGIAQAVEEYFINRALKYHEQNVRLGIQEKNEDKFILASREKLTTLPCLAGKNYLLLADIFTRGESSSATGMARIGQKLDALQKLAPYQERAIGLFLQALENGTKYQVRNATFAEASSLIVKTALTVGLTYAEVASIAREAPIPASFDAYEGFTYKAKLLSQIATYENQALDSYLKGIKIAQAYSITDSLVGVARTAVAQLLFVQGRCWDLLGIELVKRPPYPAGIDAAQREEYQAQFEEASIKFTDQALSIYKNIVDFSEKQFTEGLYVTQAYVRLFQSDQELWGLPHDTAVVEHITSGPQWKSTLDTTAGWTTPGYADSAWTTAHRSYLSRGMTPMGFTYAIPDPLWFGTGAPRDSTTYVPAQTVFLRRSFSLSQIPQTPALELAATDSFTVWINGTVVANDTAAQGMWRKVRNISVTSLVKSGSNVLAILAKSRSKSAYGVWPDLSYTMSKVIYRAQPPGSPALNPSDIAAFKFLYIPNFSDPMEVR